MIYFIINKLTIQQNIDKVIPEIIDNQLALWPINGSTNIEARNTWPASRKISAIADILGFVIVKFIIKLYFFFVWSQLMMWTGLLFLCIGGKISLWK